MSKNTFEVTDHNFADAVLKSETPVLVDFWAEWCGPCKAIAPAVEELAGKYTDRLKVGKMDVDANGQIPMMFDIQGIPTLILFKGGRPVQTIVGYKTKDQLEKAIAPHITETVAP